MSDQLHAVGLRLLAAIASRDYDAIEGCFSGDADFRVLTPRQLREHGSAREAAERYRAWLGELASFELLDGDVEVVADRLRIHYRFRGHDPEKGWRLNDHTGYAAVADGRIAVLTLTCSGYRPTDDPS